MGGDNLRSDYIQEESFRHILAALTPMNRLALEVSLCTGLRIDDVLHIRTEQLRQERFTVKEMKTGKRRRVRLPVELRDELQRHAGRFYVFENRLDQRRPRTRQAVNKDLKRACELFRLPKSLNVSPHSARKVYAVGRFRRCCSIQTVQELLNHSDESVTVLYAMADVLTTRRVGKSKTAQRFL